MFPQKNFNFENHELIFQLYGKGFQELVGEWVVLIQWLWGISLYMTSAWWIIGHDGATTWKCFPHYWPFVRGINLDSLHKWPILWNFNIFSVISLNKLSNTLRPRQNGRHFAEDIFKCIFLNENVWIVLNWRYHWSLFLRFKSTIFQHWFR